MLELAILSALYFGPCHGYEIKKLLKGMKLNNNTLYPLFKKLVENNYVTMEEIEQEGKPKRKVYTITEAGRVHLFDIIRDFSADDAASDDAFYLRLAFFQYLDKDTISKILEKRETYLEDYVNHTKLMSILRRFPDTNYDLLYLKNYADSRIFNEKQLVRSMKEKYGIK